MKKQLYLRKIRDKRSYSFKELADTLGVHIRTAQSWHQAGMPIIDGTAYPYLVLGVDAKRFLKTLSESKKTKLGNDQCYCVACHRSVAPLAPEICSNNRKIGKDKESISLIGNCPHCGRKVTRFGSREIPNIKTKKEVTYIDDSLKGLPLFNQPL